MTFGLEPETGAHQQSRWNFVPKRCKQWIMGTIPWDNQILFCMTNLQLKQRKRGVSMGKQWWECCWPKRCNRPSMVMWIKENLEIWTVKSDSVHWGIWYPGHPCVWPIDFTNNLIKSDHVQSTWGNSSNQKIVMQTNKRVQNGSKRVYGPTQSKPDLVFDFQAPFNGWIRGEVRSIAGVEDHHKLAGGQRGQSARRQQKIRTSGTSLFRILKFPLINGMWSTEMADFTGYLWISHRAGIGWSGGLNNKHRNTPVPTKFVLPREIHFSTEKHCVMDQSACWDSYSHILYIYIYISCI